RRQVCCRLELERQPAGERRRAPEAALVGSGRDPHVWIELIGICDRASPVLQPAAAFVVAECQARPKRVAERSGYSAFNIPLPCLELVSRLREGLEAVGGIGGGERNHTA